MMHLFVILAILFLTNTLYATTSITQHGITWTFDADYTTGQFINGDYWVVDTGNGVNITNISPGYTSTPRAMNGSMINPDSLPQGYDGTLDYDSSLNVGINISSETPLTLNANESLVSTISNQTLGGPRNDLYINTAAVLTCLSSSPPTGSFRPGISATTKTLHNISSISMVRLRSLATPGGISKPNISTYANYLQIPWLCHGYSWSFDYMHPSASGLDNYYFSGTFAEIALILHLDYTNEEKNDLLINFIQLGIDIYSTIESGSTGFQPDGGHGNGRKWPILFAGIMLDYAPMKNIGQKSGAYLYENGGSPGNPPSDYIHFTEDGQTFYVTQTDVDITNGVTWEPDTRSSPNYPYTTAMIGMPEWGIRHSTDPRYSDSPWGAMYRHIGSGPVIWPGFTIAAQIMNAKSLWNNNALFDYVDRYMAITNGDVDPFGYTVYGETSGSRPTGLISAMYDTYRNYTPGTKYKNVKSITQDQQ